VAEIILTHDLFSFMVSKRNVVDTRLIFLC